MKWLGTFTTAWEWYEDRLVSVLIFYLLKLPNRLLDRKYYGLGCYTLTESTLLKQSQMDSPTSGISLRPISTRFLLTLLDEQRDGS